VRHPAGRLDLLQPDPNASDNGSGEALVFFLFDLLHLDGETVSQMPVSERKEHLRTLLSVTTPPLQFSDHPAPRHVLAGEPRAPETAGGRCPANDLPPSRGNLLVPPGEGADGVGQQRL